jgi:hypothetical protein
MVKRLAVIQSNYVPWKGYFDIINSVDEFILFDDMQYTRRDWRNRNKIKTPRGLEWLTIPVQVKGKYFQSINETKVSDDRWAESHWKTIIRNYSKAPCFIEGKEMLLELYEAASKKELLSDINYLFIKRICDFLNIRTEITWSSSYNLSNEKTERLVSLCQQAGASEYISGPSARDYIDIDAFKAVGIRVTFYDYSNYPEYHQLFPPFDHYVSIIDLLLNEGKNAYKFMHSF